MKYKCSELFVALEYSTMVYTLYMGENELMEMLAIVTFYQKFIISVGRFIEGTRNVP